MASLKRPETCNCGSTRMLKEKNPERYVCYDCKAIIVQRGSKPDASKCRECGVERGEVPFKDKKNLCMQCSKASIRQYNVENHSRRLQYKKDYYQDNRERLRKYSNEYWQSSMDTFLNYVFRRCKGTAKQRLGARRRDIEFEVTLDYVRDLYEQSGGRCAISGMVMTHKWSDLMALSIDRIDSSRGYVEGNVQLVCMWANLAKQKFSNDDMKQVLDTYYNLRKSQESE